MEACGCESRDFRWCDAIFDGIFEISRLRNSTADSFFFRYFDDGCLQCRRDGGSTRNLMHLQRSSESQKVEYFRVR